MQRRNCILVAEHAGRYCKEIKNMLSLPKRWKEIEISNTPNRKKTNIEPPDTPGEEIQLDFTGNLHKKINLHTVYTNCGRQK